MHASSPEPYVQVMISIKHCCPVILITELQGLCIARGQSLQTPKRTKSCPLAAKQTISLPLSRAHCGRYE